MSYSSKAKDELCRLPLQKACCQLSELSGALHLSGSLSKTAAGLKLKAETESAAVARRLFTLIKNTFGVHARIEMHQNRLKKNHRYALLSEKGADAEAVAKGAGLLSNNIFEEAGISPKFLSTKCCRIAFLRGAFLGGGSLINPEKLYHLEFTASSALFAGQLAALLNRFDLGAKTVERKSHTVVYLKEGDKIASFLSLIGAHTALLEFENIRVMKEVRNNVNRAVNCETANVSKTVNAALQQAQNIKLIQQEMGLEKLPPALREMAELRLNNPEAPLSELVSLLSEPLGRSGVNHRLRKLNEIAENIKKDKGEI